MSALKFFDQVLGQEVQAAIIKHDQTVKTIPTKEKKMDRKLVSTFQSLQYEDKKRETLANEKKKYIPKIEFLDSDKTTILLNNEVNKMFEKKRWKGLDACFKWQLIEKYLATKSIILDSEDLLAMKNALRKNLLKDVIYDHMERKIVSLNFTIGNHLL
jgi:spermidine/putrescine-binding protein